MINSESEALAELTVYTRLGCHLCDDMLATLEELQISMPFSVNIIDVDADPHHQQRYGELVPVLMHHDVEICHYFLDIEALKVYFSQASE